MDLTRQDWSSLLCVEGLKDKEIPVLGTTTTPQTPYMVVHARSRR